MTPVKVIYIVGWGHSGSTLLDLILGTSPRVTSVGEIIFFDYYRTGRHHPKVLRPFLCTCEAPFGECPFWRDVLTGLGGLVPSVVYDPSIGARLRWLGRFLGWVARGRKTARSTGDDGALFEQVLRADGGRSTYVCDSSKDFSRLIRLLLDPNVELYPIHLVRDVRAVAHSYASPKRTELGLKRVSYYRALVLWTAVNALSRLILRLSGRPWIALGYERFCRDPGKALALLNERLDLGLTQVGLVDRVNSTTSHDIGGNLLRFKQLDHIRCDERWRREASRAQRLIGTALFGWLNGLWVNRDSTGSPAGRSAAGRNQN